MAERRSGASGDGARGSSDGARTSSRPKRTTRIPPAELARRAANELAELVCREPEGVVSLERTGDGWRVGVEVVETRRIPDTADILAEYEVDLDGSGKLVGYHRTRRYSRGRTQDDR